VPDLDAFDQCVSRRDFADRVRDDMDAERELALTAVPSFVVEGTLLTGPSPETLASYVHAAMKSARHGVGVR
jgi:predicted DsbA family dithiol-disulfide isomerase